MKKKINLVLDCSGSMGEDGRRQGVAYVLHTLRQSLVKQGVEVEEFTWNHEGVHPLDGKKLNQLPWSGGLEERDYRSFCREKQRETTILLSDGEFPIDQYFPPHYILYFGEQTGAHRHKNILYPENLEADVLKICRTEKRRVHA
ncbi:MAG: hypothetical protein R3Y07_06045 [Eubacteriales bacterium]